MGVFLASDEQIGYVQTRSAPEIRDGAKGTQLKVSARLRMRLLGEDTLIRISGSGWTDHAEGLKDFEFKMVSGEHRMSINGVIEDDLLRAVLHTGGEEFPFEWPVSDDLVLWNGLGASSTTFPPMEVGDEFFVDTFDPMTMSKSPVRIHCVGDETLSIGGETIETKLVDMEYQGFTTRAWINASGETMRAETPFGFTLQRITPEEATRHLVADNSESLLNLTAVRPKGLTPFSGAKRMRFRITGVRGDAAIPTDATQQNTGPDEYTIVVPDNVDTRAVVEGADASLDEFLRGDPWIQTNHPKITELAASIVGDEEERWQQAQRVYDWVYQEITKVPVLSVPSALEVLDTREGDCNEHTVLYTALARASGVPTRIAIGVVWSEHYGGFYYHAWPEVFVGEWVWLDPTLGQPVADATHIKLLNGDLQQWPKLAQFLGSLDVEVLEIE